MKIPLHISYRIRPRMLNDTQGFPLYKRHFHNTCASRELEWYQKKNFVRLAAHQCMRHHSEMNERCIGRSERRLTGHSHFTVGTSCERAAPLAEKNAAARHHVLKSSVDV
jgi:hypothetical protein